MTRALRSNDIVFSMIRLYRIILSLVLLYSGYKDICTHKVNCALFVLCAGIGVFMSGRTICCICYIAAALLLLFIPFDLPSLGDILAAGLLVTVPVSDMMLTLVISAVCFLIYGIITREKSGPYVAALGVGCVFSGIISTFLL